MRLLIIALVVAFSGVSFGQVKFGVDVLREHDFIELKGKRVGLVANPASVDARLINTADVLRLSGKVKLVSMFGPEHGIYGDQYAGGKVEDRIDARTGLKVYSLFGKNRGPTTQARREMDALVFDMQDIGSRSYTYISTMRACMESCAKDNLEMVILDRPNPLGGERIEGPGLDKKFQSFVGYIEVPYVHGMTMGELAQLVREKYFPKYQGLRVVKMEGWKRSMVWDDTGHEWVATSPHIPTAKACAGYAATGIIGELLVLSVGVGYTSPFEMVGAPWINAAALEQAMNAQGVAHVRFREVHFRPFYNMFLTVPCNGVQVHFDPQTAGNLVEINFRILRELGAKSLITAAGKRIASFDKVCGSDEPHKVLESEGDLDSLFAKWKRECEVFRAERQKWLLYE